MLLLSRQFFILKGNDAIRKFSSKVPNILKVSLVGRPNTGKSTLFNRLTRSKLAIVSSVPGTTRDRKLGTGYLAGMPLQVIDTGGLDDRGAVSSQVQKQVDLAMNESDVVLFMLDSRAGVTALDLHFARWIRKITDVKLPKKKTAPLRTQQSETQAPLKKEVVILANKSEGAHMSDTVMDTVAEACRLGFGEPILISASHGFHYFSITEMKADYFLSNTILQGRDGRPRTASTRSRRKTGKAIGRCS